MSIVNTSIEANNIIEKLNSNTNNSTRNIININSHLKNSVSDQLLYFKDDILKDVKQFESQISSKFNTELNNNNSKIQKFQETLKEMSQKLENISSNILSNTFLQDKTNNLSESFSKLEQKIHLHEIKIKNTNDKLTATIDDFNDELSRTVIYPKVIGPMGNFKTFHEFIDFIVLNINNLLFFKEKLYTEFKDFKTKADSSINNFKIKLDYQGKNCNAFTSSSVRASEQNMRKALEETLKNELDIINKKFEILTKPQEDRISFLIENAEIIKKFEHNFEKIEEDKIKQEKKRIEELIKKRNKLKNKLKKPTSIVKQYIEGKLKENELIFKRRRSIDETINKLENIKEQIDIKPNYSSFKNIKIFNEEKNNNRQNSFKSDQQNEITDNIESSFDEKSGNDNNNENYTELQKNKIKKQINDLLLKTDEKYKKLAKERNDYLFNYIQQWYKDSSDSNTNDKIKSLFSHQNDNNINNEIKIIKDNENPPINKNLYITDKEKQPKKEKTPPQKQINQNLLNIHKIELSKINIPKEVSNLNNIKRYEPNDLKEMINIVKQNSRESLLPIKTQRKIHFIQPQTQNQNKMNKTQNLFYLSFKPNSRNKIIFNSDNKKNNQINSNIQNYSFNKQTQKNNLSTNTTKNEIKKININFSSFQENNKEKDEQKMKKIFTQIKDFIPEDEKFLIKNRFLKYGYNKDIIFAENKSKFFFDK